MFERIDDLVTEQGLGFQAWDDRYGKGVWAALGTWEDQIDVVRELSSRSDLDMIPAMDYIFSTDWLPYVTGRTLHEAMKALEVRLATLPSDQLRRGSDWTAMIGAAIEHLREAYIETQENVSIDIRLQHLPRTFDEAVQSLLPTC